MRSTCLYERLSRFVDLTFCCKISLERGTPLVAINARARLQAGPRREVYDKLFYLANSLTFEYVNI